MCIEYHTVVNRISNKEKRPSEHCLTADEDDERIRRRVKGELPTAREVQETNMTLFSEPDTYKKPSRYARLLAFILS